MPSPAVVPITQEDIKDGYIQPEGQPSDGGYNEVAQSQPRYSQVADPVTVPGYTEVPLPGSSPVYESVSAATKDAAYIAIVQSKKETTAANEIDMMAIPSAAEYQSMEDQKKSEDELKNAEYMDVAETFVSVKNIGAPKRRSVSVEETRRASATSNLYEPAPERPQLRHVAPEERGRPEGQPRYEDIKYASVKEMRSIYESVNQLKK